MQKKKMKKAQKKKMSEEEANMMHLRVDGYCGGNNKIDGIYVKSEMYNNLLTWRKSDTIHDKEFILFYYENTWYISSKIEHQGYCWWKTDNASPVNHGELPLDRWTQCVVVKEEKVLARHIQFLFQFLF